MLEGGYSILKWIINVGGGYSILERKFNVGILHWRDAGRREGDEFIFVCMRGGGYWILNIGILYSISPVATRFTVDTGSREGTGPRGSRFLARRLPVLLPPPEFNPLLCTAGFFRNAWKEICYSPVWCWTIISAHVVFSSLLIGENSHKTIAVCFCWTEIPPYCKQ